MNAASAGLEGLFSPVVTPFKADYSPDADRLVAHGKWLLSQNCGLALFGTNSEANSLGLAEKMKLLDHAVAAGLPAGRMMPGTGCCSLPETVEITRHAVKLGAGGVLMLPPFYYKGVSDEGLYRHFSEVVQRVGDAKLRVYLYHIPPVAQVAITLPLIERLIKDYPDQIVGIKDSSGEWSNTKAMLHTFPGFRVFCGSEGFLLRTMQNGGAGCISATANINPGPIHTLWARWQSAEADKLQADVDTVRAVIAKFPMIPALKATVERFAEDDTWSRVRPPLVELDKAQKAALAKELDAVGFTMPGLREARRAVA